MVVTVQGIVMIGRGCPVIGKNLCGGGPGGSSVWIGDMGHDIAHC